MLEKIAKAPDCRRMLDPAKCNARCAMGYDFTIKGTRDQKCRYNCFLFPVEEATWACLKSLLEREMQSRAPQ